MGSPLDLVTIAHAAGHAARHVAHVGKAGFIGGKLIARAAQLRRSFSPP